MIELNFPFFNPRLQDHEGYKKIFDAVRKKWIILTPEEWVRQHLIHYLNKEKGCPLQLMAVEKSLLYNGMKRRSDVVVFDRKQTPRLLVECKSPDVKLHQSTFDQAARYNMTLEVPYLMITNGLTHYCCHIDFTKRSFTYLEQIPGFDEMSEEVL